MNATRSASDPPGDDSRTGALGALDEALQAIRLVLQRPGYRSRLLKGAPRDVGLNTVRLLRAVQRAAAAPSVGVAAEMLAIDPSTASRVADQAVESGYLERRPRTSDRRRARLHLTGPGESLLDRVTARRRALLAEVTDAWDSDDLDRLVVLLAVLQAGFDRLEQST